MEFRLLGPFEVVREGRPVPLRPKQRALLAFLLLRRGEVVSTDRLVSELWGEEPPRTAIASLQNTVSRLRKELGPAIVVTRPPGYTADVAVDELDAARLERLRVEAAAASGETRAELLRAAVELRRGPALSDLAYEPFAATEAARLDDLYAAACEDLVEAELAVGRGGEALRRAEGVVAEFPFRERARAQLMLALYASGRHADALAAFREARRVLRDELGLEPSPALRRLEQAILNHDARLLPPRRPSGDARERRSRVTVVALEATPRAALDDDPELWHDLSRRFAVAAERTIATHGGRTFRIAGDELLGVFGIPAAHEDDALRAALAAAAVRDDAATLGVAIVAGVATGEVVAAGAELPSGEPVSVARLLQRAAASETILLAAATRSLLRDAVDTEPAEPVAVPAGGREVAAARLIAVREDAQAVPRGLGAELVGRRAELEELRAALARVRDSGSCELVTLLGEAGIGKSRLAAELRAGAGDARTLAGRCVAYGAGATYLPIVELVRQVAPGGIDDLRRVLASDADAELVVSRVAEVAGLAEGAAAPGELFWAVRRLLEALARERPLLLVLEDAHWAEPTLLDLVEHVAKRSAAAPMTLVCLARPELLERRRDWPGRLIALEPLSVADAARLIDNLAAGSDLDPAVRARVVEAAGGNPLFAEQLFAHVAEGAAEGDVPATIEALLASRLDRLGLSDRDALEVASVIGTEFSRSVLAALVGPGADHRLRSLTARGLLRVGDSGKHGFHHALVRDVAYAAITKRRRAELHERVAEHLEREGAADEVLGYHLEQAYLDGSAVHADGGDLDRLAEAAAERLGAAGMRAWRHADAPATATLLGRATALMRAHDPRAIELDTERALALRATGDVVQALETLERCVERADRIHDRRVELRARLELVNLVITAGGRAADDLIALAERAIPELEAAGDDRSLGRAWILLGDVLGSVRGRNADWAEAAEHALRHYKRLGWPFSTPIAKLAAALYHGPEPVARALRRLDALLPDADRYAEATIRVFRGGLIAQRGLFDDARESVATARRIYEDLGQTLWIAGACGPLLARVESLAGRFDAAEAALRETCAEDERLNEGQHLATQLGELAEAVYAQGRYEEAADLAQVAAQKAGVDDVSAQSQWRTVLAKTTARAGDAAQAEVLAQEAVALTEPTDSLNRRAQVLLDLAEVLRIGGRPTDAEDPLARAIALYRQKGNVVAARNAAAARDGLAA